MTPSHYDCGSTNMYHITHLSDALVTVRMHPGSRDLGWKGDSLELEIRYPICRIHRAECSRRAAVTVPAASPFTKRSKLFKKRCSTGGSREDLTYALPTPTSAIANEPLEGIEGTGMEGCRSHPKRKFHIICWIWSLRD